MKKLGIFLTTNPYSGGAFQYCQSMIEALCSFPRDEFQIVAIYYNEKWEEYLEEYPIALLKINKKVYYNIFAKVVFRLIKIMNINVADYKSIYSKIDLVCRKLSQEKIDLLICPGQEILPAKVMINTVAVVHDLMHRYERFPEVVNNGEFKSREYLYKNLCLASTAILVDSNVGKRQLLECYGEIYSKKVHILPFTPPRYLLTKKYGIPTINEGKYIFYPAQFWKHKNHKNLLLAISLLKEEGLNIKLLLVGSAKNGYNDVLNLIREKGLYENVKILGYVENEKMIALYKNARAMIMPSFFGPTNIPPLEGFILGCPVAVANVYGMPEQVGNAALLFDPNNIKEIAAVIKKLWLDDELCARLSEEGFKRIETYKQENFSRKIKEIVESIL